MNASNSPTPKRRHQGTIGVGSVIAQEIVRLLLDSGENPNPHSHSTPLHQAALAGHLDVVRLLVERGAKDDIKVSLPRDRP